MKSTVLSVAVALLLAATAARAAPPARSDLDGVWSNASITQLTRPASQPKLVVTPAEAAAIAAGNGQVRRAAADAKPSDLSQNITRDGNTEAGYNAAWLDPGMTLAQVRGEYRTSWLVEPANGQLPMTDKARAQARLGPARQRNPPPGPEAMAPNDRCLIGSRGSGGPGMLNNLYNNNYQIVVTPQAVAIVVEMVHDARIIPVFPDKATAITNHRPPEIRPWLGDSVGWWEGKDFVVETTNVHPEQGGYGPIFLSPQGKVVERFTRWSDKQILYSFEVSDPVYYTQPWKAEMSLNAEPGQVYEYACHEGNYAMEGMLAGAREEEARARAAR